MGLQAAPAYISQAGYLHPAELMRNINEVVAGGRSGISRWGQFEVSGTGSTDQIQITAGSAMIVGSENASQGAYFAWGEANELVSVPAANGSNPRIDTLLLRIADPQYGTITGLPRAYWQVVSGTAAASPSVLPDSTFNVGGTSYQPGAWLRVADIRRNVGDTVVIGSRIYPSRLYTRTAGRVVGNYAASTTGFGGLPSGAVKGDLFYAADLGRELVYNGTSWCEIPGTLIASGWRTTSSATTTSTEIGVLRLDDISLLAGQCYDIESPCLALSSSQSGDAIGATYRITTDGSTPNPVSSPRLSSTHMISGSSSPATSLMATIRPASNISLSVVLTLVRWSGTGTVQMLVDANHPEISISVMTAGTATANLGTAL